MAGKEIVVQLQQNPIIIQYTKQGMEGPTGPVGPQGDAGITWELELTMSHSPNGRCSMRLYKNGELASNEIHYVDVFYLSYSATDFVSSSWSRNISGTYAFDYTGVRAIKCVVYEDSSKELMLCANTCNYGKSATVEIGNVTNVEQGSEYVTNTGNEFEAVFDFGLPRGMAATVSVGNTTTLPAGSPATVTQRGTTADRIFDFGIPNGGGSGARVEQTNLILDAGAIYTPSINSEGVLSWTNNASLDNPSSIQVTVDPDGTWDSTRAYQRLDIVTYNGSSYIADRDVPSGTAITNTTYWQLIAQRGVDGVDGNLLYATFNLNTTTGQLEMMTDSAYDGPEFAINSSGWLQVTI